MAEFAAIATIIQIADIGFRLSLKLFTFAQTVANADEAILSTSKDVSLTSSVLKEVGELLKADQSSRTYSATAIGTATAIVTECSDVFQEMEKILVEKVPNTKSNCRDKILTTLTLKPWERFKWSYWQPKLQLLRSNLDRLRSTLSVMLHVITYQRIVNTAAPDVRANHTALIRDLIRSKEKQAEKYEKLKRSLTDGEYPVSRPYGISNSPSSALVHHRKARERFFARTLQENGNEDIRSLEESGQEEETELAYASHLSDMFARLITEVDIPAYRIGLLSRRRIKFYLHKAQSSEFDQLIHLYGANALEQMYGLQSPREEAELVTLAHQQGESSDRKRRRGDGESSITIQNKPIETRESLLQKFWLSAEGISRVALQESISKMLGPEASFKSHCSDGFEGYDVIASKSFSSQQMQELLKRSRAYISQESQLRNGKHHPDSHGKARAYGPRGDRNRDDGRDQNHDHKGIQDRSTIVAAPRGKIETIKLTSRSTLNGRNNWFVDGEGIHPEVMRRETRKRYGSEAYSRPTTHNGVNGYIVEAYKPYTSEMIEHLRALSRDYKKEQLDERLSCGYQGISVRESLTSGRISQDYALQEPPVEDRYKCQPNYLYSDSAGYYSSTFSHARPPSQETSMGPRGFSLRSTSLGENRDQSFNKEPQANLDSHDDDDKAERSGITTSDDVPFRPMVRRSRLKNKRFSCRSSDNGLVPPIKRQRYERDTGRREMVEDSGDIALPALPRVELPPDTNLTPQSTSGGLSDEIDEDKISKAVLYFIELWTPVN